MAHADGHPRSFAQLLAALVLAGELTACTFDSSAIKVPPPKDKGGVQVDAGSVGPLDGGTVPTADGAPPATGSKTCLEISACCDACTTDACCHTCYNEGSADGQAKMGSLEQCWSQAEAGGCKTPCGILQSQACYSCVDQACAQQEAVCYQPPVTGTKTCAQIAACADACATDTCYYACYYQGSADGQAKMDALCTCWGQAESAGCKTQCAIPDSQMCYDCEDKVCATPETACYGL